jgi:hypothetical protein
MSAEPGRGGAAPGGWHCGSVYAPTRDSTGPARPQNDSSSRNTDERK